eukprot:3693759-Pleurochrysis_carterae.AAC.3
MLMSSRCFRHGRACAYRSSQSARVAMPRSSSQAACLSAHGSKQAHAHRSEARARESRQASGSVCAVAGSHQPSQDEEIGRCVWGRDSRQQWAETRTGGRGCGRARKKVAVIETNELMGCSCKQNNTEGV